MCIKAVLMLELYLTVFISCWQYFLEAVLEAHLQLQGLRGNATFPTPCFARGSADWNVSQKWNKDQLFPFPPTQVKQSEMNTLLDTHTRSHGRSVDWYSINGQWNVVHPGYKTRRTLSKWSCFNCAHMLTWRPLSRPRAGSALAAEQTVGCFEWLPAKHPALAFFVLHLGPTLTSHPFHSSAFYSAHNAFFCTKNTI